MKDSPKHEYSENMSCQNKYGEWVPAIPEPWHGWRKKCMQGVDGKVCGRRFKGDEEYRAHYALKHILGL